MRTKRRPQTARLTPKERLERVPHLRVEVQVLCGGEKRVNIARESLRELRARTAAKQREGKRTCMLLTIPPCSLSLRSLNRYMTSPHATAAYTSNTRGCGARDLG